MTVPPPVIVANRACWRHWSRPTFRQNTPAIATTETQYAEMWAQDATAMYWLCRILGDRLEVASFDAGAGNHQPGRADRAGRLGRQSRQPRRRAPRSRRPPRRRPAGLRDRGGPSAAAPLRDPSSASQQSLLQWPRNGSSRTRFRSSSGTTQSHLGFVRRAIGYGTVFRLTQPRGQSASGHVVAPGRLARSERLRPGQG